MSKEIILIPVNPEHDFALVELFRWEYGRLPNSDDTDKEVTVHEALKKMSKAIEDGCKSGDLKNMPSPMAVCSVLNFTAFILEEEQAKLQNSKN